MRRILLSAVLLPVILARQAAYLSSNATALYDHAVSLMQGTPLLDTHVDMPQVLRVMERRPMDAVPAVKSGLPGHVDIPKLRAGHSGGVFFSAWAPCPDQLGDDPGEDFLTPLNTLRDTIEMFDLIQAIVSRHDNDMAFARSSDDVMANHKAGKISALIGVEGAHMLGNSLSTLRIFAQLGTRYLTLTHTCHNVFASSAGFGPPLKQRHEGNGLSDLGRELVYELNRLGILVDLSHVSDETMEQAITLSRAPIVFTHSGARSVHPHVRNVPDKVIKRIGLGAGQQDGVILSVFYPPFIADGKASVVDVADHIEHIADMIGRRHVGIGSDFDGMYSAVSGLEDASKYPNLVMELLARDWSDEDIRGLLSGNLLRIMDKADEVKAQMSNEEPSRAIYDKRCDLPAKWGGVGDAYLPTAVKEYIARRAHDEL